MNDSIEKGKQYWEWHSLEMIMNNPGPTHLLSPPDASPALNKMQERTEPPHQRAGRQQGTESEREKDTHLQLYCLVQSVRLALTATSILSSPSLSPGSLFESFSLTHTLIQIHSFSSAHSQARVRQPHVSPCSASGWEERVLQGAAITQDTGTQDLDALGQFKKIETFQQDGIAEFSFIILKSKPTVS